MADRRGPKLKGPTTEKEIKIFEGLCGIQCTLDEVASAFDVTKDTIIKRIEEWYGEKFSTVFAQKREKGKISLRRAQWQTAIDRQNTVMQIFLGKQYLGQMDKPEELIGAKAIVYSTKIGSSGEILTEIQNREDWEAKKNFDVKSILIEDQKSKTVKKTSKKASKSAKNSKK